MPINKARYSFKVIKRQCAIVHLHHAEAEDDNAAAAVEAGDASYAVAASSADELLTTFSYKVQATQFSNWILPPLFNLRISSILKLAALFVNDY